MDNRALEDGHRSAGQDKGAGGGQGKRLGAFLCWAVVFADIGTSVYYTPGILFGQVGVHAALFVSMTLAVFLLLTLKYAEVAARYPEGGGVVTVATHAIHPFAGLLGGMLILVDYFLTAAISALSGVFYLSVVVKPLAQIPVALPVTLLVLAALALLNVLGVKVSATASAVFATIAALSQLAVVFFVVARVGPAHVLATVPRMLAGPHLTPLTVLTGYAGAFLAFSGLESIAQLSPAMRDPRLRVSRVAMGAVVVTIALTSPLLTLWSTTLLDAGKSDPNQFISLLGGYAAGRALEIEVAVSGALLLIFASNTAIIGCYHVVLALARLSFLPQVVERRNTWRDTPHWAILAAVAVPLAVLVAVRGNVGTLGDLYAFGLLGAFCVTCLGLDIVRWHERHPASHPPSPASARKTDTDGGTQGRGNGDKAEIPGISRFMFALGVLTTALVVLAWATNLFAKPLATVFGGGVTIVGVIIGLVTHRLRQRGDKPAVFPHLHRHDQPIMLLSQARRSPRPAVLAVVPEREAQADALVETANRVAAGGPIVFLYHGTDTRAPRPPRFLEIADPYRDDPMAQAMFEHIARIARQRGLRRQYHHVYLPRLVRPGTVGGIWRTRRPRELLVVGDDPDALPDVAASADRLRRSSYGATPIMRYVTDWEGEPAQATLDGDG